jgi:hypothetical protein
VLDLLFFTPSTPTDVSVGEGEAALVCVGLVEGGVAVWVAGGVAVCVAGGGVWVAGGGAVWVAGGGVCVAGGGVWPGGTLGLSACAADIVMTCSVGTVQTTAPTPATPFSAWRRLSGRPPDSCCNSVMTQPSPRSSYCYASR